MSITIFGKTFILTEHTTLTFLTWLRANGVNTNTGVSLRQLILANGGTIDDNRR